MTTVRAFIDKIAPTASTVLWHLNGNVFKSPGQLAMQPAAEWRAVALADFNLKRADRWGRVHGVRKQYQDYREMLDQENLDGVFVATTTTPVSMGTMRSTPRMLDACVASNPSIVPPIRGFLRIVA